MGIILTRLFPVQDQHFDNVEGLQDYLEVSKAAF
jgi:hypothetical protein